MKNYRKSDWAINKFSKGIVYRFTNRIVVVTLADYLLENPHGTEQDFWALKEASDAIYEDQDRCDYRQTWKNDPLCEVGEIEDDSPQPDELLVELFLVGLASEALKALLHGDLLTSTQRRRCDLHFMQGRSLREIAEEEGVGHTAVDRSIQSALRKIVKFFKSH